MVDVQQHFNDLELRIRNFALVVTGAFIGLDGYALKDGGFGSILGVHFSISGLVVGCALLPLLAFYLMDRLWYHRLLMGSVKAADPVETSLRALGLVVDLGGEISRSSPFTVFGWKVHSKYKMDWFYGIIAAGILVLALILAFAVEPAVAQQAQVFDSAQAAPEVRGPDMSVSAWEMAASIAQVAAALFAGIAAIAAWRAARNSNAQSKRAESVQREHAIDAQWMRYQDFYKDTIGLYAGSPGMALERYERLDGVEKRKLHLAAIALLQTLDLAYRAEDSFRAKNIRQYLQWNEGPLATVGAIDAGALKDKRTFEDWNAIRAKHGKPLIEFGADGAAISRFNEEGNADGATPSEPTPANP
jgi:hypothetical protein